MFCIVNRCFVLFSSLNCAQIPIEMGAEMRQERRRLNEIDCGPVCVFCFVLSLMLRHRLVDPGFLLLSLLTDDEKHLVAQLLDWRPLIQYQTTQTNQFANQRPRRQLN